MTKCTHQNIGVINSRPHAEVQRIRRCKCLDCGHRWTTAEIVINTDRDNTTNIRAKIVGSLLGISKHKAASMLNFIEAMKNDD